VVSIRLFLECTPLVLESPIVVNDCGFFISLTAEEVDVYKFQTLFGENPWADGCGVGSSSTVVMDSDHILY
jgi:hypothetical protein